MDNDGRLCVNDSDVLAANNDPLLFLGHQLSHPLATQLHPRKSRIVNR